MPAAPSRSYLFRVALTLLFAWLAAELCVYLHTPLPWMIGPLLATSIVSILGAPTLSHSKLRNMAQWTSVRTRNTQLINKLSTSFGMREMNNLWVIGNRSAEA